MKDTITTLLIVFLSLKMVDFGSLSALDIIILLLSAVLALVTIAGIIREKR